MLSGLILVTREDGTAPDGQGWKLGEAGREPQSRAFMMGRLSGGIRVRCPLRRHSRTHPAHFGESEDAQRAGPPWASGCSAAPSSKLWCPENASCPAFGWCHIPPAPRPLAFCVPPSLPLSPLPPTPSSGACLRPRAGAVPAVRAPRRSRINGQH